MTLLCIDLLTIGFGMYVLLFGSWSGYSIGTALQYPHLPQFSKKFYTGSWQQICNSPRLPQLQDVIAIQLSKQWHLFGIV